MAEASVYRTALAEAQWAFNRGLPGARRMETGYGLRLRSTVPFGDGNVLFVRTTAERVHLLGSQGALDGFDWSMPLHVYVPEFEAAPSRTMGKSLGLVIRTPPEPVMVSPPIEAWAQPAPADVPGSIVTVNGNEAQFEQFRDVLADSFRLNRVAMAAVLPAPPKDYLSEEHGRTQIRLLLASDETGRPVGTATATVFAHGLNGKPVGVLSNVAVLPGYRRRGWGRALVREAMRIGATLGAASFTLRSTREGIPLYTSLGFLEMGPRIARLENRLGFMDRYRVVTKLAAMVSGD